MKKSFKSPLALRLRVRRVKKDNHSSHKVRHVIEHVQHMPRPYLLTFMVCLVLLSVAVRSYVLQVYRNEPFKKMVEEQYLKEIEIPARRGLIFDRNQNPLAVNNDVQSLYVRPRKIQKPDMYAAKISKILGLNQQELLKKLKSDRVFVWIKRRLDPKLAQQVVELKLPHVGAVTETRRYYPNRMLLSHVLGAVNLDGQGIEGLESYFNDDLAGSPATLEGMRDARGQTMLFDDMVSLPGVEGQHLHLTIDRDVQLLTSTALASGIERVHGKAGSAVVMNVKTGEILALANYPEYNPNTFDKTPKEVKRNRAVTDFFEPGSTFKTIMVSAALEENVVKPSDMIFCENGAYRVGTHTIHDVHPMGLISVRSVIASSSNIGATKIAMQLGRDRFYHYIQAFGFGSKSGISLPGESSGLVRPASKWPLVQLATVSYGQGISVNAVQLVQAYAAIANDGVLVPPRLVAYTQHASGQKRVFPMLEPRRVVNSKTAALVRDMLEAVVNEKGGTGSKARVAGVRTAGKTATAQKPDLVTHAYAPDKYVSNFAGYVPADAPELAIVVVVDEPQKGMHFGGVAAGPIFQEIATGALHLMHLVPQGTVVKLDPRLLQNDVVDTEVLLDKDKDLDADEKILTNAQLPDAHALDNVEVNSAVSASLMPNLQGMTVSQALAVIRQRHLEIDPEWKGLGDTIMKQFPSAGSPLKRVKKVQLFLSSSAQNGLSYAP